VYQRAEVLWRRTFDRLLLLVPTNGEAVTLQGTGADLWAQLAEPGSIAELAERLAEAYVAPVEQIASDIAPVLEALRRCGALEATGRVR
jgi:hypothetical protein